MYLQYIGGNNSSTEWTTRLDSNLHWGCHAQSELCSLELWQSFDIDDLLCMETCLIESYQKCI